MRNELEFGFYEVTDNLSKSEYVIRLYNQVRMLSDAPKETDTVDKFSRHFDRDIQQAVITQRINTVKALVDLLDVQENIGPLNAARTPVKYENFNASHQFTRQEPSRSNYASHNQSRQSNFPENRNH